MAATHLEKQEGVAVVLSEMTKYVVPNHGSIKLAIKDACLCTCLNAYTSSRLLFYVRGSE